MVKISYYLGFRNILKSFVMTLLSMIIFVSLILTIPFWWTDIVNKYFGIVSDMIEEIMSW